MNKSGLNYLWKKPKNGKQYSTLAECEHEILAMHYGIPLNAVSQSEQRNKGCENTVALSDKGCIHTCQDCGRTQTAWFKRYRQQTERAS